MPDALYSTRIHSVGQRPHTAWWGATQASIVISIRAYNLQCASVLGYLVQLFALPASLVARERHVLSTLLRFPPFSLKAQEFWTPPLWGLSRHHLS